MADPQHERWREWLVQAHHKASQDFDKAVMTLGAGALAISLAFVDDYAPDPVHKWLLGTAWALLALSLLTILSSFLTSQRALLHNIERIDRDDEPEGGGGITPCLNYAAAGALIVGIGFLVSFVMYNL